MDKDSRWLKSDSQILARVRKEAHKQGMLLTLDMPWGEEFQAVVEKWDFNSAQQFCELAREQYNARKDEEEAKQARAANDRKFAAESEKLTSCEVSGTETVEAPKTTVAVNPLDPSSVAARIAEIRDREAVLFAESEKLRIERTKLSRILDVLEADDALSDDATTVRDLPTEKPPRPEGQSGVDRESCETEPESSGAEDSGGDDQVV